MNFLSILIVLALQVAAGDFVQVPGATLRSRFDTALESGRSSGEESFPILMDIAENHSHLEVRKQAIFWLGRKDDPRVVDFFTRLLRQQQ